MKVTTLADFARQRGLERLVFVKIDIEGHEWTTLLTLFDMCETDGLRIDVLNVELHLFSG